MPDRFHAGDAGTRALPSSSGSRTPPADSPQARRLRRPSWRDTRLVVGLLLVLGSVLGGAGFVRAADNTVPVYQARRTLPPGTSLSSEDVVPARVRISGGAAQYLPAAGALPALVVLRTIGAGEILPVGALGVASSVDVRPVAVPVDADLAAGLHAGSRVDVWVADAAQERDGGFTTPHLVASGVDVVVSKSRTSPFGSSGQAIVQLLLPPDLVPKVIDAVDNEAAISVLPVPVAHPQGAR